MTRVICMPVVCIMKTIFSKNSIEFYYLKLNESAFVFIVTSFLYIIIIIKSFVADKIFFEIKIVQPSSSFIMYIAMF